MSCSQGDTTFFLYVCRIVKSEPKSVRQPFKVFNGWPFFSFCWAPYFSDEVLHQILAKKWGNQRKKGDFQGGWPFLVFQWFYPKLLGVGMGFRFWVLYDSFLSLYLWLLSSCVLHLREKQQQKHRKGTGKHLQAICLNYLLDIRVCLHKMEVHPANREENSWRVVALSVWPMISLSIKPTTLFWKYFLFYFIFWSKLFH